MTRLEALGPIAGVLDRTEAEILACLVFDCTRTELYAHPGLPAAARQVERLEMLAEQRRAGRPIQYITGVQQFRFLRLRVGPGVLVPRPETEMVVQECLAVLAGVPEPGIIDIGTGSGAIALALATEREDARVWATEISPDALEWARTNRQGADASNLELIAGDLFSPLPGTLKGRASLVVSNPPYLSDQQWLRAPADVRQEPKVALTCGDEGLEITRRIVHGCYEWLAPDGWLVLETSPDLCEAVRSLLARRLKDVEIVDDLAGRPRIARGRKPWC